MAFIRNICSGQGTPQEIKARNDKIQGLIALVAGVAMIVLACVFASGLFGTNMYFVGAGIGVLSIVPFVFAGVKLACKAPEVRTVSSAALARKQD